MATTTSKRRTSPERIEYRRRHVVDWGNSGLGMRAYCEKVGIAINSLRSWKRQFEEEDAGEAARPRPSRWCMGSSHTSSRRLFALVA